MCAIVYADNRTCLYRHVPAQLVIEFLQTHDADDYCIYEYGFGWYAGSEWLQDFV